MYYTILVYLEYVYQTHYIKVNCEHICKHTYIPTKHQYTNAYHNVNPWVYYFEMNANGYIWIKNTLTTQPHDHDITI